VFAAVALVKATEKLSGIVRNRQTDLGKTN
jgi:hypothetical protein